MSFKPSLRLLLYEKTRLAEELARKLGHERAGRAASDYHARKAPVHCGATVHSVVGCTHECTYCYLPDMGVSFSRAQPYALSGEEMALALLSNPYFLPGPTGTYIAIGSLGEPLHPVGVSRTLEHIEALARLRNPMQLSTKVAVSEELAQGLRRASGAALNPLVTVVALRGWRALEPKAPDPYSRLEGMAHLRRAGLHPMLFLRPIVPSFEGEAAELLREAKRHGAAAVVLGGLRVTRSILARLERAGVDVKPILERVRGRVSERQVSVPMHDVKLELADEARRAGLTPLYSACCANTLGVFLRTGQRIPCAGLDFTDDRHCARCPVDCRSIKVEVDPEEVASAARELLGLRVERVEERGFRLVLAVRDARGARRRLRERGGYRALIETAFRRRLDVEPV